MTTTIIWTIGILAGLGLLLSLVLFFVAKKFKVEEDPRIDEVEKVMPGANCGGCGKAGCRALAEAFVKQGSMEGLRCAPGGDAVAQKVAALLGCAVEAGEPQVAVVRCASCHNGTTDKNHYDGLKDCAFAHSVYAGENGCVFGCLGFGNCAAACQFDALKMDPETGAPIVDDEKCVAKSFPNFNELFNTLQ